MYMYASQNRSVLPGADGPSNAGVRSCAIDAAASPLNDAVFVREGSLQLEEEKKAEEIGRTMKRCDIIMNIQIVCR